MIYNIFFFIINVPTITKIADHQIYEFYVLIFKMY